MSFAAKEAASRPRSNSASSRFSGRSMAQDAGGAHHAGSSNPYSVPKESTAQEDEQGGGWTASIASKIANNVEIKAEACMRRAGGILADALAVHHRALL